MTRTQRFVIAAACLALFGGAKGKGRTVPVVAAAHDLPVGTVVTFEDLVQRQVPEELITSSVVKPDSASYIVNQRANLPILSGDWMLWSMFETTHTDAEAQKCAQLGAQGKTARDQVAFIRQAVLTPTK